MGGHQDFQLRRAGRIGFWGTQIGREFLMQLGIVGILRFAGVVVRALCLCGAVTHFHAQGDERIIFRRFFVFVHVCGKNAQVSEGG